MRKVSEFIGKPLFTKTGEKAGTVKNAIFTKNLKTLRAFEYFDEQEDEHTLPLQSIDSAQDALIVKSLAEKQYKDILPAPFGMTVYSETGEELGKISDFELDGAAVTALILSGGRKIESARIASIKDALIADLTSPLPLKPPKGAARPRKKAKDTPVGEAVPATPAAARGAPSEKNLRAGSALLTGKRAPADVLDARGNVIVKKDSVITAETLRRAMANNKIFELTLSVLKAANGMR